MSEYTLTFISTAISVDVATEAGPAFAPVLRFFRHLITEGPGPSPDYRISVLEYDPDRDVPTEVWFTESSVIRQSTAQEFTFFAHRVERAGRVLYINHATMLDAPQNIESSREFVLRVTPGSTVQVIDFVRDLIIRTEEARGTVVLHACGVRRGDKVAAIGGAKGAGKTTTLLSMLLEGDGWHYFSGDKLFCLPRNGCITVYPWRDYPHVGVGTIRAHPALERWVAAEVDTNLAARTPEEKLLLQPDLLESWLGADFSPEPRTLSALVLPELRSGGLSSHWNVRDQNAKWALLNTIVERTSDTTFFTWQTYLVPDYFAVYSSLARMRPALSAVSVTRLRGVYTTEVDELLGTVMSAPRAGATR